MRKNGSAVSGPADVIVGFVPLLDAAPLIAAHRLDYFRDEGLSVRLERQIGWGNVRDKLVFGHLHASHALVGMPPVSMLAQQGFLEPLTTIMGLGVGGNAITFGRRLTDVGIDSLESLARSARGRRIERVVSLAHVFGCSMHHYLLRDWLASSGINPDQDVRLCVLPPPQMPRQMERGCLDGFCVGEPWNTVADRQGLGKIVAATTDLLPDHPEKVLAASQRWLKKNQSAAESLIRAVLRGCDYCSEPANQAALAEMLARPECLDMPADVLLRSLTMDRRYVRPGRQSAHVVRSCAMTTTFPAATHGAWLVKQMVRWRHLPADTDAATLACSAVDSAPYRRAAETFTLTCPPDDLPPMRLRNGWFDPKQVDSKQLFPGTPGDLERRANHAAAGQGV